MAATTLNLELQELHTAVTGTSSHSMTIRTLAYPLTIKTITITAKSEYFITMQGVNVLQEIYGLVKITASGETFQSERFAVKEENNYSCDIGMTFEQGASVSIQVYFYRNQTGSTTARHLFYQGNISSDNAKQAEYGLDITSTNAFYCKMTTDVNGIWNMNENNKGYPYTDCSSSELFTVYSEPKRWNLWKSDENINDGYPYIFEYEIKQNGNVYIKTENGFKPCRVYIKTESGFKECSIKEKGA